MNPNLCPNKNLVKLAIFFFENKTFLKDHLYILYELSFEIEQQCTFSSFLFVVIYIITLSLKLEKKNSAKKSLTVNILMFTKMLKETLKRRKRKRRRNK